MEHEKITTFWGFLTQCGSMIPAEINTDTNLFRGRQFLEKSYNADIICMRHQTCSIPCTGLNPYAADGEFGQ